MRHPEPRSFAPIEDDELPPDVLNFVKLFQAAPDPPEAAMTRAELRARRRAVRAEGHAASGLHKAGA